MAKKIRQRSRKSQIITLVVAGGALVILHLALVAILVAGYIDESTFFVIFIEFFFFFLDLPFIIMVVYFLRNDLRRWRRSRRDAAQPFVNERP